MTELSRRSLFAGIGALIAAPAIVRAASLMPVRAIVPVRRLTLAEITREWSRGRGPFRRNTYVTFAEITREAMNQVRNSNSFIENIDRQWAEDFACCEQRLFTARPEWIEQVYPIVHAAK